MRDPTPDRRAPADDDSSDVDSESDGFGEADRLVADTLEKVGDADIEEHAVGGSAVVGGGGSRPREPGLAVKTTDNNVKRKIIAWKDLPHKGQLTVLTMARLAEPLVQTSLQVSRAPMMRTSSSSSLDGIPPLPVRLNVQDC